MFREYIANSRQCYFIEVSLTELKYFPLLAPEMAHQSETLL